MTKRPAMALILLMLTGCADLGRDMEDLRNGKQDSWTYDYAPLEFATDDATRKAYFDLRDWAEAALMPRAAAGPAPERLGPDPETTTSQAVGIIAWDTGGDMFISRARYEAARKVALKRFGEIRADAEAQGRQAEKRQADPIAGRLAGRCAEREAWRRIHSETLNAPRSAADEDGDLANRFLLRLLAMRNSLVDREGVALIKEIFAQGIWPSAAVYGADIERCAVKMVANAFYDRAFQRDVERFLAPLAASGRTDPEIYETLRASLPNL